MFLYNFYIPFVLTKESWKDLFMFCGVFNKTIIPLALVGYKMIVAKSARLSSHIQQALIEQLLIFPFKDGRGRGKR